MEWITKWDGCAIEYRFDGETFQIEELTLQIRDVSPVAELSEDALPVLNEIYLAETAHGVFWWRVISRQISQKGETEIESVVPIDIPSNSEVSLPNF